MRRLAAAACTAACLATAQAVDWSAALAVLTNAIDAQVFPGCAAGVIAPNGTVVLSATLGAQVYPGQTSPLGGNAPVSPTTLWDMASLTKITGATTATAVLYAAGLLQLDTLVCDPSLLGPAYAAQGKGNITIRDLMLHQAGYPPDPVPNYQLPAFGCPSSTAPQPNLTFSCSERIFASLLNQTLQYPTGTQYLYSDLSMITMQYVLGTIVSAHGLVGAADLRPDCAGADPIASRGLFLSCHFEAYVRTRIHTSALGLANTQFLPPLVRWSDAMPTYNDPTWRHFIPQGQVSDENSYALGGIAGHAGIFTDLPDALRFLGTWAYSAGGGYPLLLNASVRSLFTTVANASFSPRALGWTTQAATDTYRGCGNMSAATFYHTGYTGTLLCADPVSGLSLALLTTRVYPNTDGNAAAILLVRQQFASAVVAAMAADSS